MIKIEINQRVGKKIDTAWVKKVIKCTLGKTGVRNAEISVAFIGNQEMKKLNHAYRGKNKTTDVLSFVYEALNKKNKTPLDGEIIISYPEAARQGRERGCTAPEEIKLLLVHGILHLCGYDHEKSAREAKRMENLQQKLLNC
jgi:rRNA maturation RNase YbeY